VARIDLNADLGEGAGHDAELMPLVTSANIACGAHAGDAATMRAAVRLARRHGVAVGAHPGYADRAQFGRVERTLSPRELGALVTGQIAALRELAPVRHVKLHGALYHLAARDAAAAAVVADAVRAVDADLIVVGLAGSELLRAARARGLRVAAEAFADRTYRSDGSLTPRAAANAVIDDERLAVTQVVRMVSEGVVRATDGTDVRIAAETVCVHGDGAHAVVLAQRLRRALAAAGVDVKPL
jgi:UPF0271 protein